MLIIKQFTPDEDSGVKEPNLLNSAVNRPKQSAFGMDAYPTIYEKAAALYQSLAQNYPFFNANKRTAFVALDQFLKKNQQTISVDTQDAIDFTVKISDQQNNVSIGEIAAWIETHIKALD